MEKTRPYPSSQVIDVDPIEPNIFEQVKDYALNRLELAKIEMIEKSSQAVSSLIVGLLSVILGLLILIFLSVGLGLYLGDVLESRLGGFLIVAGIYLLLAVVILVIRKSVIESKLINILIKKFLTTDSKPANNA